MKLPFGQPVAQHATPSAEVAIDAATRRRFAACFRRYQEMLGGETKLVRERMVAMAGPLGDATMVPLLGRYLEAPFPLGEAGQRRTAAHAVNALARITGVELRFAADGAARSVDAAADLYRQHLGR